MSIDFHDYFYLKQVGKSHVKKLEYNFKLEEYSELGGYYESNLYASVQFHVENGKLDFSTLSVDEKSSIIQQWNTRNSFSDELDVLIQEYTNSPLSTASMVDDIIVKMLIEKEEIFNNLQILPHKLQTKLVSKELMFESSTQYNGQIPYQMLSYEMFKFVAVTNLLLGLIFNQGIEVQSDPIYRDLESIINYNNVSSLEDVSHRLFISDIFDYKFYETGSILLNLNKDKKLWSNNILINFDSYINDFLNKLLN